MEKPQDQTEQPATNGAPATVPENQQNDKPQETTNEVASPTENKPTEDKLAENEADKPSDPTTTKPKPAEAESTDRIEEVKKDSVAQEAKKTEDAAPVDTRPSYLSKNLALSQFFDRLPAILESTGHNEMWGVTLKDSDHPPTVNIMIKFLRANEGNVKEAEGQLTKSLEWRKKMDPLAITANDSFSSTKFKGLGYVSTYNDEKTGKVVFTWNIYGSVKNINATFGDCEEFIKWRVALMELAIRELKLGEATTVMDYDGEDPYQMIQVHDYQNVSFLRMNPSIRNASRQTIELFSMAYPELLSEKFFVNVPVVMGWVFTALKVFLSKNTIKKFHPITNGTQLAREFTGFGSEIPKAYGGSGNDLAEVAQTVAVKEDASEATPTETPAAEPTPEKKETESKTEETPVADEPGKTTELTTAEKTATATVTPAKTTEPVAAAN